jgi:hypothetical protein
MSPSTITELAHLRLLPPSTLTHSLLTNLKVVLKVSEEYTGHRFYYLQQIEDPSLLYLVGEWDSLEQHMQGFIPSQENQELLESLKGMVGVEWLLHVGVGSEALPDMSGRGKRSEEGEANDSEREKKGNRDAEDGQGVVWCITRFFVKEGERDKFLEVMSLKGRSGGGGWRVDKEEGREEFVWFGEAIEEEGWDYMGAEKFVVGIDVKHVRNLRL